MEYHIQRGWGGGRLLCFCSHSGKALTGVLLYAQVYVRVRLLVLCVWLCVCLRMWLNTTKSCVCVFKSGFSFPVIRCHSLAERGAFSLCLGLGFQQARIQHWPSLVSVSLILRWRERTTVGIRALKKGVDDEEKAITVLPSLSEGSSVWI